jgi:hypothetical protein
MHRLPATAYLPMTPVRTASCILMLMLAIGLGEGNFAARESTTGLHLMVALTINYLLFLCYRSDSDARGFTRSRLLSVAVVALPLAAVPYYLLRSRPVAERGVALGAFVGLLLAMPAARWVGIGLHLAIRQAAT